MVQLNLNTYYVCARRFQRKHLDTSQGSQQCRLCQIKSLNNLSIFRSFADRATTTRTPDVPARENCSLFLALNLDNACLFLVQRGWSRQTRSKLHTDKSPIQPFCAQYTPLLRPNGFSLILIARNGSCFSTVNF